MSQTKFIALFSLLLFAFLFVDMPSASAESYPSLFDRTNKKLQQRLEEAVDELGLTLAVRQGALGVALVDVTDLRRPKVASLNGNQMMYAASLPKIAILFGVFKRAEQGSITYEGPIRIMAHQMIRYSSNTAATELLDLVQPSYLADLLTSDPYRLYDPQHGGGLWVGKEYSKAPAWKGDPLKKLVHAATALQTARFFYLLLTDKLISPELRPQMEEALGDPGLEHKFVLGMKNYCPRAKMWRKSGSWESYHSDSAIIEHSGKKYIAVALTNNSQGSIWLEQLTPKLDQVIFNNLGKRKKCARSFFN